MVFIPAILLSLSGLAIAGGITDPLFLVGNATVFNASGQTACGYTNIPASEFVAGISKSFFEQHQPTGDNNPNDNTLCGQEISVTYQGKTIQAKIVEECAGCTGLFDLLLSTSAFSQLANPTVGTIQVDWRLD